MIIAPQASQTESVQNKQEELSMSSSDGSFNRYLESAKKRVSKSDSLNSLLSSLDSMFSKSFSLDLSTLKNENIESDYKSKENEESAKKETKESNLTDKDRALQNYNKPEKTVYKDVKEIKQALINYIGNPGVQIPFIALQNISKGDGISKQEMQTVIDTIIQQAKLIKTQQKSELSLMLNLDKLGMVDLTIADKTGIISINIAASYEMKKELQKHISELEKALEKARIECDHIRVVEAQKKDGYFLPS